MFATGTASNGSTIKDVENSVAQFTDGMKNPPLTEVVQTAADLPFPAPSDAKGAYWRGTVYLVADNLSSSQDAREAIAHEMIGHYGLSGFFGGKLADILNHIHAINPRVRLAAAEWTLLPPVGTTVEGTSTPAVAEFPTTCRSTLERIPNESRIFQQHPAPIEVISL